MKLLTLWKTLWKAELLALPDPYWLCRCEGWRVLSPEGRVGTVARVLFGSHVNSPDALLVRSGLFHSKEIVVPADAVGAVDPQTRKVLLVEAPQPTEFPSILHARERTAGPAGG